MDNNLEKEFCSYEQALALKELGYDKSYLAVYGKAGRDLYIIRESDKFDSIDEMFFIKAPLKQQVLRWFRGRYLLDGLILPQDQSALSPLPLYFMAVISYNDGILKELFNTTNKDDLLHYDTYEEAENACIDKLIEIAKQKEI